MIASSMLLGLNSVQRTRAYNLGTLNNIPHDDGMSMYTCTYLNIPEAELDDVGAKEEAQLILHLYLQDYPKVFRHINIGSAPTLKTYCPLGFRILCCIVDFVSQRHPRTK